ncbi:hypothetical protein [Sicyoidochytrium minutum DNA virus]|nr:hypothetical protein [Sicyoidochytrium minutum DNA virus]BDC17043.1 hypothetical protein [Sicyoidochytrium minutum DNA virus]
MTSIQNGNESQEELVVEETAGPSWWRLPIPFPFMKDGAHKDLKVVEKKPYNGQEIVDALKGDKEHYDMMSQTFADHTMGFTDDLMREAGVDGSDRVTVTDGLRGMHIETRRNMLFPPTDGMGNPLPGMVHETVDSRPTPVPRIGEAFTGTEWTPPRQTVMDRMMGVEGSQ